MEVPPQVSPALKEPHVPAVVFLEKENTTLDRIEAVTFLVEDMEKVYTSDPFSVTPIIELLRGRMDSANGEDEFDSDFNKGIDAMQIHKTLLRDGRAFLNTLNAVVSIWLVPLRFMTCENSCEDHARELRLALTEFTRDFMFENGLKEG